MKESLNSFILENFENALVQGHIQVYYQPVIRTISGQVCSFEALARWHDPARGLLSPDVFIPVLEQKKQIHLLDSFVIREVCRRIRQTIDSGLTPIPVSVNLSRLDFSLCDIYAVVDQHVSAFRLPHDFLYIEITESILGEQEGLMHTVVDRFHAAGYQVWMDDFGSGYSSLNMLKDYSFNELKLDIRFLSSFNQRSRRILTSVIQMAKDIDIHTLVEGVENEGQYTYLRNIGCEKVQGFYFGKPLPYGEAMANLESRGIEIELPRDRKYYDEIGRINLLSSVPFLGHSERRKHTTGRQLNSIPLALLEIRKDDFSLLFCNAAFERNAKGTGVLPSLFEVESFRQPHPFSVLPVRVLTLMESTRVQGSGHMIFVSNEEYFELHTKCIARRRSAYCVLVQLNNLSQANRTTRLDEGLRQIYTLFDRIILINYLENRVTPLYVGMMDYLTPECETVAERAHAFAERWIFPEDRARYECFMELSTLEERLNARGRNSTADYFRFLLHDGEYAWKQFILLRCGTGEVLSMIRDAHTELGRFQLRPSAAGGEPGQCAADTMWKNLLRSDVVSLFWKDTDRRFLGASRGFLDYYGFSSDQEIIGRNDEELGWHVHPDSYMHDELRVIHEGITTHNVAGHCICKGENREIVANKTPLYNEEGKIVGLLGSFIDRELLLNSDVRGSDSSRRDEMTGLLNSRGLYEQAHAFQDEYYLRNTDFTLLHVSIDDIAAVNQQYGFDFGDKVIAALGTELRKTFGISSSIGRLNGYQFVMLHQVHDKTEPLQLCAAIRQITERIQEVDGMPFTLYLSVGYALFSEFEDLEEMGQSAEMRLLADHDEHTPLGSRQSGSSEFFRLYDDLPISYAVYKVFTDRETQETDAILFYANHVFERRACRPAKDMLGLSVHELFPTLSQEWYDMALRAATLGETQIKDMYYPDTGKYYYMTASQVIRHGYCAVTYQELEEHVIERAES